MNQKLPSEAECKRASSLLDELTEPAFAYAHRKRLIARPFARFRDTEEWWDGFPEEWEEHALGMLAAGAVFARPDRVAAFLRGTKTNLRREVATLARRWRTRPWVWAFFSVAEELGDRRLRVRPIGAPPSTWSETHGWREMLLYSRVVTDNYRRGSNLFFGLLVDIGPAFATYGALIPFRGLDEADALFMADVVAHVGDAPGSVPLLGETDSDAPVSDTAAGDPFPFLAMLRLSETPPVRTPQGPPGRYASWVDLPEDADAWSESAWRESTRAAGEELAGAVYDEVGAGITIGEGSPMYDPMIYLARDSGRAFLEARTRTAYDRGRNAAGRIVGFPEEPDVATGIIVLTAASHILGLGETLQDECDVLRLRFEEELVGSGQPDVDPSEETDDALPSSIEEVQAIADRLIHNHNERRHETSETIAAALGVDPAVVDNVRGQLENTFSRMDERTGDAPGVDRFGLSPRAFARLLRPAPPDVKGVFRLRKPDELNSAQQLIAEAPVHRGVSWLLEHALSDAGLGATKAGYISPQLVRHAHEIRIVASPVDFVPNLTSREHSEADPEVSERLRPKKESDWYALLRVRRLAESAGLLRLAGTRFRPTQAALRLVDDPAALYHHLLTTAFATFDWAEHRWFDPPPYLHRMAGFLLYAAGELSDARRDDGGWVPVSMLAGRFTAAVPELAVAVRASQARNREEAPDLSRWLTTILGIFVIDYLGRDFGLLESSAAFGDKAAFRTTPLYEAVFDRR